MWTTRRSTVGLGFVLASLCAAQSPIGDGAEDPLAEAVEVNNRFAVVTYLRAASGRENLVLSPFSIRAALGLVLEGAAGETREELEAILFPGLERLPPASESQRLGRTLLEDGKPGGEIRLASALWTQEGESFLPSFLERVAQRHGASLETVDFRGDPDAACARMNEWTRRQTGGLIEGGWRRERVQSLLGLVLANAFCFRAEWQKVFHRRGGEGEPFWIAPEKRIAARMMSVTSRLRHFADPRLEAVVIPYRGGSFSMLVLLPEDVVGGVAALERALTPAYLAEIVGKTKARKMVLVMPLFEIRSHVDVALLLADGGPPRVFRAGEADLSAMTREQGAFLGEMEQEAVIQVDEKGTRVAAVTRGKVYMGPGPPPPPEMHVDHPFVYAILHEPTGAILVIGRLARPDGEPLPDAAYPADRPWRNPEGPLPPGFVPAEGGPPGPPPPTPPTPPPAPKGKGGKTDGE